MKKMILKINKQNGFTLVETLVAILILTVSISAMLNLAASSFFSVRYSRNDIVGNNLVQEAVEYIRNSRDSAYLQGGTAINDWKTNIVGACSGNGCKIDPYNTVVNQRVAICTSSCEPLYFFDAEGSGNSFYGYKDSSYNPEPLKKYQTTYYRTVKISDVSGQYVVDVTLGWKNGLRDKIITQSVTLTDWNI